MPWNRNLEPASGRYKLSLEGSSERAVDVLECEFASHARGGPPTIPILCCKTHAFKLKIMLKPGLGRPAAGELGEKASSETTVTDAAAADGRLGGL